MNHTVRPWRLYDRNGPTYYEEWTRSWREGEGEAAEGAAKGDHCSDPAVTAI